MVANLGFFDESENQDLDAPIDRQFSQSQTIEESKDMTTEESKETGKKHPAEPISREEIEAKFNSDDH